MKVLPGETNVNWNKLSRGCASLDFIKKPSELR